MEKYLKPELALIKFDLTDVISTSGGCESDNGCPSDCRDNDCVETIPL